MTDPQYFVQGYKVLDRKKNNYVVANFEGTGTEDDAQILADKFNEDDSAVQFLYSMYGI